MGRLTSALSYSNVMATIAVFLALGGAAYAALGRNVVKSRNIAPGAVRGPDLAKGAVTSPKLGRGAVSDRALRNGAVTNRKIKDEAVTGTKILERTLGQVPDAAELGGLAPSRYLRTERFGRALAASGSLGAGQSGNVESFISNQGTLSFTCAPGLPFTFTNSGPQPVAVWSAADGNPAQHATVNPGGTASVPSDVPPNGDGWAELQIRTDNTLIKLTATADLATGCTYAVFSEELTLPG